MKVGILVVAIMALCCASALAKKTPRETVSVVAQESSTTAYDWYLNGRSFISCYGNSCSGVYSAPASGTQQVQGAILRLQRADSSIVVAQCVAKVNIFASTMMVIDAMNANDPHAPTVYRNCRMPDENSVVEAEFRGNSVKLFWHFEGSRQSSSETYSVLGILQPSISLPERPAPSVPVPLTLAHATPLKRYSFSSDGFSISFPSEPSLTPNAGRYKLFSYSAQDPSVWLGVGFESCDAEDAARGSDVLLQANKSAFLAGSKSHILSEQKIALGIYEGLEFEAENNEAHFSARTYLVGTTLYQMSVATPIGKSYDEATDFLDSFELIPRPSN